MRAVNNIMYYYNKTCEFTGHIYVHQYKRRQQIFGHSQVLANLSQTQLHGQVRECDDGFPGGRVQRVCSLMMRKT